MFWHTGRARKVLLISCHLLLFHSFWENSPRKCIVFLMPMLLSERLLHPRCEYWLSLWPSVLAYWELPFNHGEHPAVHRAGPWEGCSPSLFWYGHRLGWIPKSYYVTQSLYLCLSRLVKHFWFKSHITNFLDYLVYLRNLLSLSAAPSLQKHSYLIAVLIGEKQV